MSPAAWCLLAQVQPLWFLVPLCMVVSLTYAATRREQFSEILRHSARLFAIIVLFMLAGYVFLLVMASFL